MGVTFQRDEVAASHRYRSCSQLSMVATWFVENCSGIFQRTISESRRRNVDSPDGEG